jgi:hypothetical protein
LPISPLLGIFAGQETSSIPKLQDPKMRFSEIALSSLIFGATALAAQLNERFIQENELDNLMKRQQFTPSTTTAEGATCADAFGQGYLTCM